LQYVIINNYKQAKHSTDSHLKKVCHAQQRQLTDVGDRLQYKIQSRISEISDKISLTKPKSA